MPEPTTLALVGLALSMLVWPCAEVRAAKPMRNSDSHLGREPVVRLTRVSTPARGMDRGSRAGPHKLSEANELRKLNALADVQ